MDTFILAEITSKWDFSGVWCLASILFLAIAIVAYATGPWSGSCTCLIFFTIACFACGDVGVGGDGGPSPFNIKANIAYITNNSQTKWLKRNDCNINDSNCMFHLRWGGREEETFVFIPAEEMMIVDGYFRMKPDGREIGDDDYYWYDETIAPANVARKHGGMGVPQWVYHPASPVYIFGIASFPALLGGMFIAKKVF